MQIVDLDRIDLQDNTTAGGPIRVAFPWHSATGAGSSAAVLFELDPGSMLAPHTDSAEEALHILAGEGEATVAGETARIRAGHIAIVPSMAPHSIRNTGDGVLRVLGIFSSATIVATFEEPLAPDGPQVMVAGAPLPIATPLSAVPV